MDVEEAVLGERGIEGETDQALLAGRRHAAAQVEDHFACAHLRIRRERAHAAGLLQNHEAQIAGNTREEQWLGKREIGEGSDHIKAVATAGLTGQGQGGQRFTAVETEGWDFGRLRLWLWSGCRRPTGATTTAGGQGEHEDQK